MVSEEYTIDGKFECNILIVEETSCGKNTFIQNLAKKQLVRWSKRNFLDIENTLSSEREENNKTSFKRHVDFKYPHNLQDFSMLL